MSSKANPVGVVVRVADVGKGIAVEDRNRVMEPLILLHRPGDPAGTGLGLATCAWIAAAHGGRLEISPGPAGGTMASIYLAEAG